MNKISIKRTDTHRKLGSHRFDRVTAEGDSKADKFRKAKISSQTKRIQRQQEEISDR